MPGPMPKPAGQRRRRNRSSTAMVISAPAEPTRFPVDLDDYCPQVQAWLRDIAVSPMSGEWDASDVHGLLLIADLREAYWSLPPEKAMQKAALAAELRLQMVEFGLSPLSRRRLQWEIERGEDAAARTTARRALPAVRRDDPRLKVVRDEEKGSRPA